MEGAQQDIILKVIFSQALERESLLLEKYRAYKAESKKNQALKELLDEFEKEAQEHLTMLKDKMIRLGVKG